MYDIFVYLFEHCHRTDLSQDNELIARKLSAAGFEESDISEALSWLAGVLHAPHRSGAPFPGANRATRAFAHKECAKLDAECRGLIMHLENIGVLDPVLREVVVDRAMAASGRVLSLEQLKLIVLMVLWNLETPTARLIAEELLLPAEGRRAH
jgi:Smg protein